MNKEKLHAAAHQFVEDFKAEGHDIAEILGAIFAHPDVAAHIAVTPAPAASAPEPAANPAPLPDNAADPAKS